MPTATSRRPAPFARLASSAFAAVALAWLAPRADAQSPAQFESPQIRPLAVSADGMRLLAINTPDHRIALFSLATPAAQNSGRPTLLREIPVGLEPVAVAFASPSIAWVVGHLADAVSVVDLDAGLVIDTLHVSDEPSDVVIAAGRAFVTCATRREIAVFDVATRTRTGTVPVFADEPRWAARSADGTTLYVAAHKSGNDTTIVDPALAPPPPPPTNPALPPAPQTGLIVDSEDPAWTAAHGIVLPDYDVFEVDTTSLAVTRRHSAVGTILFGLDVRPTDGSLWVANSEARNLVRFEPTLRGHIVDSRVTRITTGATPTVTPFDLNPGIDYTTLPNPAAQATALAQPTGVAFSADGQELFVAAFGTDRIGVVDPDTGAVLARIDVGTVPGFGTGTRHKRGPRAVMPSPGGDFLYVLNRLSNTLSVIDTVARQEVSESSLVFDPTPAALKEGRGFLYDAKLAGNGTASCAACHIDATTDNIAWDLGDRGGAMQVIQTQLGNQSIHPMKGPMLTQSLVGTAATGALHWRGDRADFTAFNGAFDSLLGGSQLPAADMSAFAAFMDTVVYPSNPNLGLDRSLPTTPVGASAAEGEPLFTQQRFNGITRCVDCHSLTTGTNGLVIPGPVLQESQPFKVAQLRNIYKRDGKKGPGGMRTSGFGQLHDGVDDDVFDLLSRPVFGPLATNTSAKNKLRAFVEAFDTGTAPTVGYARTVDGANWQQHDVAADRALLQARAQLGDCGLALRGHVDGLETGFAFDPVTQRFVPSRAADPNLTTAEVEQLFAQGRATLTYLGVPPGEQNRVGIDRDGDGVRDGDAAPARYGAPTVGCGHTLRASTAAFVGNDQFGYVAEGATPGAQGSLFFGFGPANIPFFGISIFVDPNLLVALPLQADAHGTAALGVPIPDDAGLLGWNIYAQGIFLDACGSMGVAATEGVHAIIR